MRTRVSVTSLLGALALFALANIQRARHSTEPSEIDFVVWDTEQTAWEGSNARRWSGLIPGTQKPETREVLQLSALRATLVPPHDHGTGWALRHGEAFSLLVRPTVNPLLSSYVRALTGISQLELNRSGVPFEEAMARLHGFAQGCALFSWGNDWSVVQANYELLQLPLPWAQWPPDMLDLKPLLEAAGLNLSGLSSGTVHRAVGLSSAGRVHDASWDTESLFLTLQAVLDRPSVAPVHQGSSVGHALRRAITERRGTPATRPLVSS